MRAPHPPETRAEALRLVAAGLSQQAAANRVGVAQSTVSKWARAAKAERGEPRPQGGDGEPDPEDWGAWSEWHDAREPSPRFGPAWHDWADERFHWEIQALNRCYPDDWKLMPTVLLRIGHSRLGLDGAWEALHDWCLRSSRGQAVWADERGQVGHLVDEHALLLRVQVDAPGEDAYRVAALCEAERARAAGFEVQGFAQDLVDPRGIQARGGRHADTIRQKAVHWQRDAGFPAPLVESGFSVHRKGKQPRLWAWGDVLAWEREHATGVPARRIAEHGRAPTSAEVDWLNALLALDAAPAPDRRPAAGGAPVGASVTA